MSRKTKINYNKKANDYANANNLEIDGTIENRNSKIDVKCNICGKTKKNISVRSMLNRKSPCAYCENKSKFETDLVDKYGENQYSILSEYVNMHTEIKIRCNVCGNIDYKTPNHLLTNENKMGYSCKKCFLDSFKKDVNEFYDILNNKFGGINHEILNPEEYRGYTSKNKLKFKCTICGYEFETYPSNVINPHNGEHYCAKCNNSIKDDRPYQERLDDVTENKVLALEEYKGHYTPIKHMCLECGHGKDGSWVTPPVNRTRGQGCPRCSNIVKISKGEKELSEFIESIYDGEIINNSRTIIKPKELDIYIPEKNIAIEYCGLYWHSEKYKGKKYHLNKLKESEDNGIRLIQIFEDEWENNKYMIKQKIKYLLNLNSNEKIYARKCEIKHISVREKNDFLDRNHIQGKDNSSIRLGLFYDDSLVSVITFGKLRKSLGSTSKEGQYELIRFASDIDKLIVGGFSKLLKHFIREYNPEYIKTFADLRWSIGTLYEKNGFNKTHISDPGYWYVYKNDNKLKRYHRFQFRKGILHEKFDNFDPNLTEYENMRNNNYYRIWDCGNAVYELELSK
jgi:hypothetical protein